MTKKQKREIIYKAAELVDNGCTFSCIAIQYACCSRYGSYELTEDYIRFYDNKFRSRTVGQLTMELSPQKRKDLRALLLLMFAEAGL